MGPIVVAERRETPKCELTAKSVDTASTVEGDEDSDARSGREGENASERSLELGLAASHTTTGSKRESGDRLLAEYRQALDTYLASRDRAALRRADRIGRRALAEGLALSELAGVHHQMMLTTVFRVLKPEESSRAVKAVGVLCATCPVGCAVELDGARQGSPLTGFFAEMLAAFEQSQSKLRRTNTALLRLHEIREEEARRMAHALHDQTAQLLISLHLAVEGIASDLAPEYRERLRLLRPMLDEVGEQLRQLSHELRPRILEDLGLVAAIESMGQGFSARAGIQVTVRGPCRRRFPSLIETVLYRVVQIALDNVARHARAARAEVRLVSRARWLHCSVRDDGVGFDVEEVLARNGKGSLGLIGIRERLEAVGGTFEIDSGPGRGALLTAAVPLPVRPSALRRGALSRQPDEPMRAN